jgi:hypothetical protein
MEESGKSRGVLPPREGEAPAEPNPCLPPLARNSFATPGLTAPLPEETPSFCLGKQKSTHFLSPGVVQITLVLKNKSSVDQDDRHFGPPFLLAVDELFANVRNLTLRHLPEGTLFPLEVSQYDPWVLREILHNCIAHQDYVHARVNQWG